MDRVGVFDLIAVQIGEKYAPTSWQSRCFTLLTVACLLAGGWFAFGALTKQDAKASVQEAPTAKLSYASKNIEDLRPGDRVLAKNPDWVGEQSFETKVNRATWRLVSLRNEQHWEDGTSDVWEVETLQSPQWLNAHRVQVGAIVPMPLDVEEMGETDGMTARVMSVSPCPKIKSGKGHVVLTTVSHLNNFLFDLKYADAEGNSTSIGTTGYHKFYSQERGWISAHKLQPQEELLSPRGTLKVVSLTRRPGTHRVYNMTVEQQHVYYVGELAVLVHNNGCDDLVFDSYKNLSKRKDIPGQAHHLNQDAAFRDVIPYRDGVTVKLEGSAFTDIDSPHYNTHESLESFWNIHRRNDTIPSIKEYNRGLYESLQAGGMSSEDSLKAVQAAKRQQLGAGLRSLDNVPRVPGRLVQRKRK